MNKTSSILILIIVCVLVILGTAFGNTVYLINKITPEVANINELGIVRGNIQRLVKLELGGQKSDRLIESIEENMVDFRYAKEYKNEGQIQETFDHLDLSWKHVKIMIHEYRSNPSLEHRLELINMSEIIWDDTNTMVQSSQFLAEKRIKYYRYSYIYFGAIFMLGILVIYLVKKYVKDRMEQVINFDALTLAYNRRYFNHYMEYEIAKAKRYRYSIGLIMMDIDFFKKVNDVYGHHVGDSVLKEVSTLIRSNIRSSDAFFRIGGEEFAIVTMIMDEDKNVLLAEKIRVIIETHYFKAVDHVTISMGVAHLEKGDTFEVLFNKADTAMYRAKNNGRNRVEVAL